MCFALGGADQNEYRNLIFASGDALQATISCVTQTRLRGRRGAALVGIEGRAVASDECSNVVKEEEKGEGTSFRDRLCLANYLSIRRKCTKAARDAGCRREVTL
jgi:hypothetical protein